MLCEQVTEKQLEIDKLTEKVTNLSRISEFNQDLRQICHYVDHENQLWIISIEEEIDWLRGGQVTQISFVLYNLKNKRSPEYYYGELIVGMEYYEEFGYLESMMIKDFVIKTKHVNKGYGSLLMEGFLVYLDQTKREKIKITGQLSEVDEQNENNRLRRNHFYQKFGFEIKGDSLIRHPVDDLIS